MHTGIRTTGEILVVRMNSFHQLQLYRRAFRIRLASASSNISYAGVLLTLTPMKNSKIKFLGTGLALVLSLASSAFAADHNWNEWMQNYYRAPQPDQVAPAVLALSRAGAFEGAGQPATAIGFLGQVFARNPERVAGWIESFRALPEHDRRVVTAALWYSGLPEGDRELRQASGTVDPELRAGLDSLLARGPVAIAQSPVLSESSLNLQWGAFLATGDAQHIVQALAALGSSEAGLSAAARTSLARKAASHQRVYEICQAEMSRQPADVRDQMQTALAGIRR